MISVGINPSQAQKLPLDPQLTTGKLANGFTYYVRKNISHKKRVIMYLANKSGSILEKDSQRGLAHFIEHMSFNGTKHFPLSSLVDFLEKAGVRFGADLNAYTSFDETVYQLPLPLDKPGMLVSGLQVLRDWAQEATLDQSEIDKERGVILEEKRQRSGLQQRIQMQTFPFLVNHSKYADREPIGTEEVLKNFNYEDIHSFYRDWYRPDLQAIIVVGDIDVKETVEKIKSMFSDLKVGDSPKERTHYAIELSGKNQFFTVTDDEAPGTNMQITIKFPHKNLITHADYLELVKRNLFNLLLSNRLRSISQKNAGSYLFASAGLNALISNVDAFSILLSVKPGTLEKGFGALWSEINKIKTIGFDNSELETAKSGYLAQLQAMVSLGDKKESALYAQEYVRLFAQDEASPGQDKEAQLAEAYLATISLAHMTQMARTYITDTNRDVFIVAPTSAKSSLPDENDLNNWFSKFGTSISSSKDVKADIPAHNHDVPLLAAIPDKGKIISTTKIKDLDLTEYRLSNGVRVLVKPTEFRNDEINFVAFSPGGSSLYSDRDFRAAEFSATMAISSGAGDFSADLLREKLIGKQISVYPYLSERNEGISGTSNGRDLEIALQLTHLYFTKPRIDTAAFNTIINRSKAAIASQVNSGEKIFSDSLNALLSSNHLRRKQITIEEINQIDPQKVYQIYKERFGNAANFTFIFVGNIDPEKLKPLIERYIGSLPTKNKTEKTRNLGVEIPRGVIKKTINSGSADKSLVQLTFSGDNPGSAENNLELRAIKFVLGIRMNQRLREKESGVYSPQVGLNLGRKETPRFTLSIQFSCAPANVDKLINAALEEISLLKTNGIPKDDLDKFKAEEKVFYKNQISSNAFWLAYLSGQIQQDEPFSEILNYNSLLDALTTEKLTESFNKYVDGKNLIQFVLKPQIDAAKK
ncbi:M16 family metallopeptidase [Pedobacter jamesrossensis]|uniref:M16 family metallopeptidase n=2 Tax=Pedobacter jamesrossensis TaxID=1908238 RepID=A0ABV8NLV0_9SPHI